MHRRAVPVFFHKSWKQHHRPHLITKTNTHVHYPCGIFDHSVGLDQCGVACELCGQWFHAGCQHITSRSYEHLGRSDVTWHCVICANANHSSIAYDLHGLSLTQHNITSTADSSLDTNSDSPFHPYHTSTPSRASKQDKHARRPLRFLSVNCQSIVGKVAEFDNLIHTLRPDVILGTESWLTPSHTTAEIFPRGFNIYRRHRPSKSGGGVFIAVSRRKLLGNAWTDYRLRNHMGKGKTTGTTNAVGLLLLPPTYRRLKQNEGLCGICPPCLQYK